MTQTKKNTIKEIWYGGKDYLNGLDFISKNYSKNLHLKSCYEGASFKNLAQCIVFDKRHTIPNLSKYFERPRRFISLSPSKAITGVMIVASLPEFYRYIDYESYFIIATRRKTDYSKFLNLLPIKERAEIIAFKTEQIRLIKSRFSIRSVHHWSVYCYRDKKANDDTANIRLMTSTDLEKTRRLSKRVSNELSPYRSLQFQLRGLSNKNYVLSFNGRKHIYIGISEYCTGVQQINYLIGPSANNKLQSGAIGVIGKIVQNLGKKLIWRLRDKESRIKRVLIKQSGLVKLVKEDHLHLG